MPISKLTNLKSTYDSVIIGSGLGGLTCANMLARQGHKVLLLEHHFQLGGLATWFTRPNGHIFDVSLHGFPYGMIKSCRRYWNKEIKNRIVQLKGIRFVNPQYQLESTFTREHFTELLENHFKIPRKNIDGFFETIFNMNYYEDNTQTTGELFEKYFPNRNDVHRFLLEPITYANGSTLEDLALTYGIVFSNFMSKGVYTFQGGTDKMIALMAEEIQRNGGTICTNTKVDKIEIENKKVQGVSVTYKNQQIFIPAKSVVSNAGLVNTIFDLTDKEHFKQDWICQAKKIRVNSSSSQVYFGIKKGESFPFLGDLVFTSKAETFTTDELFDFNTTSQTFSIYYPECRADNSKYENHYAVVSSLNARYEDWVNLSKDDYAIAKENLIKRASSDLEKFIPGIVEKSDWIEAATPKTFKRYTLHRGGSSFGTKFEGLEYSRNLHKQVAGLFHVGSVGIIMSGWLGAMNYGAIVCNDADAYLRK